MMARCHESPSPSAAVAGQKHEILNFDHLCGINLHTMESCRNVPLFLRICIIFTCFRASCSFSSTHLRLQNRNIRFIRIPADPHNRAQLNWNRFVRLPNHMSLLQCRLIGENVSPFGITDCQILCESFMLHPAGEGSSVRIRN